MLLSSEYQVVVLCLNWFICLFFFLFLFSFLFYFVTKFCYICPQYTKLNRFTCYCLHSSFSLSLSHTHTHTITPLFAMQWLCFLYCMCLCNYDSISEKKYFACWFSFHLFLFIFQVDRREGGKNKYRSISVAIKQAIHFLSASNVCVCVCAQISFEV